MLWLILFVITLIATLYDLHTQRIPNWMTLPLLALGLIVHFPGTEETMMASVILVIAFASKWMGAGDAKLWLGLIWAMPLSISGIILPAMFAVFFMTGLFQLVWRWFWKIPVTGVPAPAAWRALVFVGILWVVH